MRRLTKTQQGRALGHLLKLTSLPTAAGAEDRVLAWLETWARRRKLLVQSDCYGNRLIGRADVQKRVGSSPLIWVAHLDHPAFVVREVKEAGRVVADFRGGVHPAYFSDALVELWPSVHTRSADATPISGRVLALTPAADRFSDPQVEIRLPRHASVQPGQLLSWRLPPARIRRTRQGEELEAPACDNLAAVAAAVFSFELGLADSATGPVQLLFTRAEEVGFLGAIGAARSGLIPPQARLVVLENSRALPDAPMGAGPIVRVGDRSSTFDPLLTGQMTLVAEQLAAADPDFRWQRKLMTGGTCEATAFLAFGYRATCLCLPLGNYHNMDEVRRRIGPERIATADYLGLIRLLVAVGREVAAEGATDHPLRRRLEALFAARAELIHSPSFTGRRA